MTIRDMRRPAIKETIMKPSPTSDSRMLLALSIIMVLVLGFVVSRGFTVGPQVIRQHVLQAPEVAAQAGETDVGVLPKAARLATEKSAATT